MSKLIQVAFINESTVFDHTNLEDIVAAIQSQVYHDFRPTWGVTAELHVLEQGAKPPANVAWMGIFDNSDQAGALGYHDLTPLGFPVGKVFAKTDQEVHALTSVTISHETLEMLGDPYVNLCALDPKTGRLYAYESSDAVEADSLGYKVNGVTLSDFVLPQFFDPTQAGKGNTLSHAGHVKEPFTLAPGGYLSYLDLSKLNEGWQQVTAQEDDEVGARPAGFPEGSRRERRRRASIGDLKVSTAAVQDA